MEMLIIGLFVTLIVVMIYQFYNLRAITKHDKVFFSFRELRGNSILFLADNYKEQENITYNEKILVRNIVTSTGVLINHFPKVKTEFFNYKNFSRMFLDVRHISETMKGIERPQNKEVINLGSKMCFTLITAFTSYVPFLRVRVVSKVLSMIVSVLVKMGAKKLKKFQLIILQYDSLSREFNNFPSQNTLPC